MNELQKCELEILKEIDRICKKYNITYFLSSGTLIGAIRHKGFIPWDDDLDIVMERNSYQRFLEVAKTELSDKFFLQCTDTDLWYRAYSKVRMNGTTMIEKTYENINFHQGVWVDIFVLFSVPEEEKRLARFNKILSFSDLLLQDAFFDATENLPFKLKLLRTIPRSIRRRLCNKIRKHIFKPITGTGACDYYWGFPIKKPRYNAELFLQTVLVPFEDGEFPVPKDYDLILRNNYGDYMTLPPPEKRNGGHDVAILDLNRDYSYYMNR